MSRTSETARLTKRTVDAAEPWTDSEGKVRQKLYLDTNMKGFGLCVGAKSKTFFAQHTVRNRSVRVTIGRHGVFTVDEARGKLVSFSQEWRRARTLTKLSAQRWLIQSPFATRLSFFWRSPRAVVASHVRSKR